MSDDESEKAKKKKVKKKEHLWQGANEEFFQESYPSGSGQDDGVVAGKGVGQKLRKNSSKKYASYSTRHRDRGGGANGNGTTTTITYAMTGRHGTFGRTITTNVGYNNTVGNNGTIYDNTGMLPDLTDLSIPNEQKRWEEVQKIKSLPIPMSQKRELKTQLTTIPMLKLKGWRLLRWKQMLLCHSIGKAWRQLLGQFTFWNSSIYEIQVGRGSNVAGLFQLIKWAFKLNLIMCILTLTFILLPQLIILKPLSNQQHKYDSSSLKESFLSSSSVDFCSNNNFLNTTELSNCCTELYLSSNSEIKRELNYNHNNASKNNNAAKKYTEFEEILLSLGSGGQYGRSEYSPLFYGFYYYHPNPNNNAAADTPFRQETQQQQNISNNNQHYPTDATSTLFISNVSNIIIQFYSQYYSFIYLVTQLFILLISFYFIFKETRLKDIIIECEDPAHKYSDLVFTGWEHFTKDNESAKFKRKTIRREMKLLLRNEKYKIEVIKRARKARWKLFGRRILTNLILIGIYAFIGLTIFELIGFSYNKNHSPTKNNGNGIGNNDDNLVVEVVEIENNDNNYNNDNNSYHFESVITENNLLDGEEVKIDNNSNNHQHRKNKNEEVWVIVIKGFLPAIIIGIITQIFPIILKQINKVEKFSQNLTLRLTVWRIILSRILCICLIGLKLYLIAYCKTNSKSCTQCESSTVLKDRSHCWESLFGEQLYKIVLIDLTFKIIIGFLLNTIRNCIGLYIPGKFFKRIGLLRFNLTIQCVDVLYLQFLSWIGAYFAPFIPILILIYTYLLFYLNKLSVFVTCRGIPDIHKSMRISTMYLTVKLVIFGVVATIMGMIFRCLEPSKSCGPFRHNNYPWEAYVTTIYTDSSGPIITTIMKYTTHPLVLCLLTILLLCTAYYYYTLTRYGRGTVSLLKNMLVLEGHDKQFLFARLNSMKRSSINSTNSIPLTRTRATILNEDDD